VGLDDREALHRWIYPSGLKPTTASAEREWELSTQRSPWRLSQRATGPPQNVTFAHAEEKVSDSSRSQAGSIDRVGSWLDECT